MASGRASALSPSGPLAAPSGADKWDAEPWRPAQLASSSTAGLQVAGSRDFFQALARAVRQFRTYPLTSPFRSQAIADCRRALDLTSQGAPLTCRVTARELIVNDKRVGAGTIVEHELTRRLHRAGVGSIQFEPSASTRDLSLFCDILLGAADPSRANLTFVELFAEHGIETILAEMAHSPEILAVGAPSDALCDLVEHERTHQTPPVEGSAGRYLYPPGKGWVRLDPAIRFDTLSLVDLAILVEDPAELSTMLLRLTDDDAVAETREAALQEKFGDVARLFASLEPKLARLLFARLSRAVLALDSETRSQLLRRTILPGLLDGRPDGAVLTDFPDVDLAEALCLLLDFETAAPDILTAALDRLDLPAPRRDAVVPIVKERLRPAGSDAPHAPALERGVLAHARQLTRVSAGEKSFSEFSAFDLSMDDRARSSIESACDAIETADGAAIELQCLWNLASIERFPTAVQPIVHRAIDRLNQLRQAAEWPPLVQWVERFCALQRTLQPVAPDVAAALDGALTAFFTTYLLGTVAMLLDSTGADHDAGVALAHACGDSIVPALAAALDDPGSRARPAKLLPVVFAQAGRLAAAVLKQLPSCGPASARVMIRILGLAGAGSESAIGRHLVHPDALVRKEAFRALVRIGSPLAASVTAQRLHDAAPAIRAAALEALPQFPSGEVYAELQRLVHNREFLVRSPEVVSKLLDHVARSGAHDVRPIVDELEGLRFRFWNREALKAVRRARELRRR